MTIFILDKVYPTGYYIHVIELRETETYSKWFASLSDRKARGIIDVRLRRISLGNLGNVEPVGQGVHEIKIDYGGGYRIYFIQKVKTIIILLARGTKNSQQRDIQKAIELSKEV